MPEERHVCIFIGNISMTGVLFMKMCKRTQVWIKKHVFYFQFWLLHLCSLRKRNLGGGNVFQAGRNGVLGV